MHTLTKHIDDVQTLYFIGIGGIGMSAIARYCKAKGKTVSGYDRTETALTKQLIREGIAVSYEDDVAVIPKNADIVVYTPAIPAHHAGLEYYKTHGYTVVKRSDVLQMISYSSFNICVAGTHGKTTTTTMIAHLLRHTGYGCNAFLGGIAANYHTNFWSSDNNVCVIEADEYDRSFLKLSPDIAIITAMDADHLDIYGTPENVKQAFTDFAAQIKSNGLLLTNFALGKELKAATTLQYSLRNDEADAYATHIKMYNGGYTFDVVMGNTTIENIRLNMGGMHNVENMVAAIAVARALLIDDEKIKEAVAAFKGVKRRFEYIIPPSPSEEAEPGLVFIDDYAHHPEELRALISSVKTLFPRKKCTLIFQPHLYSRTRDFAQDFASVLSFADRIILLPIYPARELPIEGVSSTLLVEQIDNNDKAMMSKEELLQWVEEHFAPNSSSPLDEVLVTAGAGDIDKLVADIKQIVNK